MGLKYGCYFRVSKIRIRDCRVINISSNKIQLKEDFSQGNKILFKAVSLDLSFLGHVGSEIHFRISNSLDFGG